MTTDLRVPRGPYERRQRLRSSTGARRPCRGRRPSWRGGGKGEGGVEGRRERAALNENLWRRKKKNSRLASEKKSRKTQNFLFASLARPLCSARPLFSCARDKEAVPRSLAHATLCGRCCRESRSSSSRKVLGCFFFFAMPVLRRFRRRLGYRRRSPLLAARVRHSSAPIAPPAPGVGTQECSQQPAVHAQEQQRPRSFRCRTPSGCAAGRAGQQRGRGRGGKTSPEQHPRPLMLLLLPLHLLPRPLLRSRVEATAGTSLRARL